MKIAVLASAVCLSVAGQTTPGKEAPDKEALAREALAKDEAKGLPPRVTPGDYQVHTQAGSVTIAAEFKGHTVPNPQGPLTTEDYVSVEIGLFGPADSKVRIAADDFTLRINGKKTALSAQPYGLVIGNVKDPEYEPPEKKADEHSKTSLNTGGGQGDKPEPGAPPPVIHIPLEVQRAMNQRVRKAALPEGDRPLPQAGLIFFRYGGKDKGIHSLELIYAGAAGKATLSLQP